MSQRLVDARSLVRGPEGRFGFAGMPRGWFAIAFSSELTPGEVHRLHYFGRDLVAFRGESGRAVVADAYCPHLGAHLGHGGRIEGDGIRCPFHSWRFDHEGRCSEIPYSDVIPKGAKLGTYPVREQNGAVHVFFDGAACAERPAQPFDLPELPEEGWTTARTVLWRALRTHPQEIFENTVDMAHIGPIHRGRGAKILGKPRFDQDTLLVDLEFEAPGDIVGMPDQINDVHLNVLLRGLGYVVVHTHVRNVDVRARQRIFVTPIDEETVDIRAFVQVRPSEDAAFTEDLATLFHSAYAEDFAKDFPIWENKRYVAKPLLTKGDGPVFAYRKWCTQFYATKEAASRAPVEHEAPKTRGSALAWLAPMRERIVATVRALAETRVAAPAVEPAPRDLEPASRDAEPVVRAASPASSAAPALRVESADGYFDTLPQRFVRSAADGVDAVFQWELGGEGGRVFHALVQGGELHVANGPHERPSVSLVIPAEDYVRVVNGELDGMRAFTTGRGKVRGSIPLAMKMRTLFPQ